MFNWFGRRRRQAAALRQQMVDELVRIKREHIEPYLAGRSEKKWLEAEERLRQQLFLQMCYRQKKKD